MRRAVVVLFVGLLFVSTTAANEAAIFNEGGDLTLTPFPAQSGVVSVEGRLRLRDGTDLESRLAASEARLALLEASSASSPSSAPLANASSCSRCDANAVCLTAVAGSTATVCVCGTGYRGSGFVCHAINPCVDDTHDCGPLASCLYMGPGLHRCACYDGFVANSDTLCLAGNLSAVIQLEASHLLDSATHPFPYEEQDLMLFGYAVREIGDVDGDLIADLAIGAPGEDSSTGQVYIAFMRRDGTYRSVTQIGYVCPLLNCGFGTSLARLNDLNGDGVPDLLVGTLQNVVIVVFLGRNGTHVGNATLESPPAGRPTFFGSTMDYVGDIDDNGQPEVVIGDENNNVGYLWLVELSATGTYTSKAAIDLNDSPGGPSQSTSGNFPSAVAVLGDVNNDGTIELVATAPTGPTAFLFIISFDATGRTSFATPPTINVGISPNGALIGLAMASLGDNQFLMTSFDGTNDLVLLHRLTVSSTSTPTLASAVSMTLPFQINVISPVSMPGRTIGLSSLGDLNGDGETDFVVGNHFSPAGGLRGNIRHGDVTPLLMSSDTAILAEQHISPASGSMNRTAESGAFGFASSVAILGDLDMDGVDDVLVGTTNRAGFGALAIVWSTAHGDIKDLHWLDAALIDPANAPSTYDAFGASAVLFSLLTTGTPFVSPRLNFYVGAPLNDGGRVYLVQLTRGGDPTLFRTFSSNDFNELSGSDLQFGASLALVGNVDSATGRASGTDLAIGIPGYGTRGGAVLIVTMISAGTGFSATRLLALGTGGLLDPLNGLTMGISLAPLGDVNDDGVPDLAVGVADAASPQLCSGFFVLFLNTTGEVVGEQLVTPVSGGLEITLAANAGVGCTLASAGDTDGDGINDLLMGLNAVDDVYLAMLAHDGTVRAAMRIHGSGVPSGTSDASPVAATSRSASSNASLRTFYVGAPAAANNGALHTLHYRVV